MSDSLKVAAVQFEHCPSDKKANLAVMKSYIETAASCGVNVISFPEMCLTGYTHLTEADGKEPWEEVGETIPEGQSVQEILALAKEKNMVILFGLVEKEGDKLYNTFLACTPEGKTHPYKKIHAFEHSCVSSGTEYVTFEALGWTMGMLICYDNNIPENVASVAFKGAEIIFAPHQTGGFDMDVAGMGRISKEIWDKREEDPVAINNEILGPKGREWLLKWLPARAYDNNVFYVFTNGIGVDGSDIRTGNAMILDPNGQIMAESRVARNDMVITTINKSMREKTIGKIHLATRKPELYGEIVKERGGVDTREARNSITCSHKIK